MRRVYRNSAHLLFLESNWNSSEENHWPGNRRRMNSYSDPIEASFCRRQEAQITQRLTLSAQTSKHDNRSEIRTSWVRMTGRWHIAPYWKLWIIMKPNKVPWILETEQRAQTCEFMGNSDKNWPQSSAAGPDSGSCCHSEHKLIGSSHQTQTGSLCLP